MALFGKLFSKETCIVCGEDVGSLKRKRLSDGVICKDCARDLSPWFDAYKQSTTQQVQTQLRDRARAQESLRTGFTPTKVFGASDVIVVDERQRMLCVLAGAGRGNYRSVEAICARNPDVFSFDDVTDVSIDTFVSGHEVKRTVDGQQVSYNPRRYTYPCNVTLKMSVDNPYVSSMSIRFNPSTINIETEGERIRTRDIRSAGQATADFILGKAADVRSQAEAWDDNSLQARLTRPLERAVRNPLDNFPDYAYGFRCSRENWPRIQEYGSYLQQAEEVLSLLARG